MRTFQTCLTGILIGTAALAQSLAPPPTEGWSQRDSYSQQLPPNQQSGQPSDQQSGYPQQPYGQQPYPSSGDVEPQQGYSQAQPLSPEQLQQLVAPIALYPDTLVALVLAASTYSNQVVAADRWRQAQAYSSVDQIAAGADAQNWDPSLKGLTAFPQVLAQMDQNLQWTTDLGNAYYNQPQDVLEAVQVMRQRAQAAGNLQSTPQETVTYNQGNIELAPPDPQTVYVPSYNPWNVYGQPVSPYPGFSLLGALGSFLGSSFGSSFGSSRIRFGLGIAMGAFTHTPWGLLGWGLDWLAHSILFNNADYFSQSTTVADWGFPHGGPRAFSERGFSGRAFSERGFSDRRTFARPYRSNRTQGSFDRSAGRYDATRGQGFGRAPDRFAGDRFAGNRTAGDRFAGDRFSGDRFAGDRFAGQRFATSRPRENFSRGYQTPGSGYSRLQPQANNRMQTPIAGPQQFGRPSYSNGFSGARASGYGSRPGTFSNSPQQTYRAPTSSFQRGDFGERSTVKSAHSGGFHLFGRRHSSDNFRVTRSSEKFGGRAPKSFKPSKSFGSGHSGGGHFGGGHSSGGHSSSHHGGGHHH
jgi:Protein of unknown function (DUF3300)